MQWYAILGALGLALSCALARLAHGRGGALWGLLGPAGWVIAARSRITDDIAAMQVALASRSAPATRSPLRDAPRHVAPEPIELPASATAAEEPAGEMVKGRCVTCARVSDFAAVLVDTSVCCPGCGGRFRLE